MSEKRLTLEQFAALAAAMDSGVSRDKVLAEAKVSADTWEQSQSGWLARMAEQSGRGRHSLAERYGKLFAASRLAAEKKKVTREVRVDGPPPAAPLPVRLPVVAPERRAARAAEVAAAPPRPVAHLGLRPAIAAAPRAVTARPPTPAAPPLPEVAHPRPVPQVSPASFFVRPPAQDQPQAQLTLEQFASLRAELVLSPPLKHDEIRARYKLDDFSFRREEAAWQHKLTSDKNLLERYMQHFQYMRGLLSSR